MIDKASNIGENLTGFGFLIFLTLTDIDPFFNLDFTKGSGLGYGLFKVLVTSHNPISTYKDFLLPRNIMGLCCTLLCIGELTKLVKLNSSDISALVAFFIIVG